jgi:hypothetical protein
MSAYTTEDQNTLLAAITGCPHKRVDRMTLGGEDRASLHVLVVLDEKSTWANDIMENARYARFSVRDGRIELFSGMRFPKFRSSKIKDIAHAASRINEWIKAANVI